jgi:biopolymer transport protein ExbD
MKGSRLLLISFVLLLTGCDYIMTAFAEPASMQLTLPKEEGDHLATTSKSDLLLLLGRGGQVYWCYGTDLLNVAGPIKSIQLREVLQDAKKTHGRNLYVVIKPSRYASYKDVVDVLDEMTINDIKKYELVDPSADERNFLDAKR